MHQKLTSKELQILVEAVHVLKQILMARKIQTQLLIVVCCQNGGW